MDLSNLPPEFLAEIQRYQRQQQMAQALQMQGMQGGNRPTEMVSGHAIKQSPLAALLPALQMYIGGKKGAEAGAGLADVQQRAATASQTESGDLAKLFQSDPKAAIVQALAAKFPQNRKLGEDWGKQYGDRVNQWGNAVKDTDPAAAGGAIASQTIPGQWNAPSVPSPEFKTDPAGNPYAVTTNRKGEQNVDYAPKGVNVSTNLASKEGEILLTRESGDLDARQAKAQAAMQELANAQRLVQVMQDGAAVGGGAGVKQTIRKVFQAFNVDTPETGPTDSAKQLLGERVLDRAKSLGANPSNADREAIKEIVGNIDTDPTAISRLISYTTGNAIKTIQDFQSFLTTKQAGSKTGLDYSSAGIGVKLPEALFGPQQLQLNTIQALQQAGGDISQFKDPSGQPFQSGSQFNLSQPTIQQKPALPNSAPISLDDYLKMQQGKK